MSNTKHVIALSIGDVFAEIENPEVRKTVVTILKAANCTPQVEHVVVRGDSGNLSFIASEEFFDKHKFEQVQKLRVYWIPQVPMKPFYVDVMSVEEGVKVMDVLANYDLFQYENNIKGDYANMGGLQQQRNSAIYEDNPEGWVDWDIEFGKRVAVNFGDNYTDDGLEYYFDDPREYLNFLAGQQDEGNSFGDVEHA